MMYAFVIVNFVSQMRKQSIETRYKCSMENPFAQNFVNKLLIESM